MIAKDTMYQPSSIVEDEERKEITFSDRSFLEQTTINRITQELTSVMSVPDTSNNADSSSEPHQTSSSLWASFDDKVANAASK